MTVLLCLLLLAGAVPARAAVSLAEATGLPVVRVELVNGSRERDSEVRGLFLLGPGDVYSAARVQRSLDLLSQKLSIRDVRVTGEREGEGLALRVEVEPEPLIRSIGFEGNRSLPERQLTSKLRSRVDRPVRPSDLAQDARTVEETYEEEGFPEARAVARVEPGPSPHWLRLVFSVEEGPPLPVLSIEPQEDLPMDGERLRALLGLREGRPASRRRLREGVRRLVEVLHKEGYPEARSGRAHFRRLGEGAVLVLPLTVGERIDVRVEGIDEWSARSLRAVARSRYGEVVNAAWAVQVAGLMVEELRGHGYRSAGVSPELGTRYGRERVTFRVSRGPRVRLDEVRFVGNEEVPANRLRRYMSLVVGGVLRPPPFSEETLASDLKVLKDYYASHGYLDARLALEDLEIPPSGRARLLIRVEEGRRYHLGEIQFVCDEALLPEDARRAARLSSGAPVDPGELERARVRILRELEGLGHPEARVSFRTERQAETATVGVTYRVEPGPRLRFGKTVIAGNARTQTKVIRRELTWADGDLWSPEEILRSRQRLHRLGFFQRVRIEPLPGPGEEERQDVRVEVEEQDAGSVTFGFGYGTEEGIKGFAGVAHSNIMGYGRSLGLRADFDRFDRSYVLNFREPWLFNHRIDLRLSLIKSFQRRESFDLDSTAFQASLEREFTERVKGSLLYTLEANELSDVADEAELSDIDVGTYLLSAVGPVVAWDSRDDPFNPRSGFHHTFQAEWALEALGSEVQYDRYLGSMSGYVSAGDLTLALLARGGIALRFGATADLPVNKRFFLGGRTTVRGFDRDEVGPQSDRGSAIGGDVMANLKAELRFPLWKQLGAALFWDAGNVWNRTLESPDYSELRQAAGSGIRFATPVGPLALDVGFKLDRKSGEAPYAWHFTVGNVF